jgi:lipoprotein-releasing system ATP-binding protein
MSNPTVVQVEGLNKSFTQGTERLEVLVDLSLQVAAGERVAVVGLSGSGKSTLLHLIAGLDQADSGSVKVAGQAVFELAESDLCKLRNEHLGFVYQFHHLLADFSALENVAMPLLIGGVNKTDALARASNLLQKVNLENRASHKPAQLSGGERQRVAIARALVNNPTCVLADEPTGNLDETSAAEVDELMLNLSREMGTSFVVVTHNTELANRLDRVLRLHNGQLI